MTTLGPALAQGCNPQKKSSFPNLPKAITMRPQPRPGPGQRASTRVLTQDTETHTTHTRKSCSLSSELEAHCLDTVPANPEKPHPKAPPQDWAELQDPQSHKQKPSLGGGSPGIQAPQQQATHLAVVAPGVAASAPDYWPPKGTECVSFLSCLPVPRTSPTQHTVNVARSAGPGAYQSVFKYKLYHYLL